MYENIFLVGSVALIRNFFRINKCFSNTPKILTTNEAKNIYNKPAKGTAGNSKFTLT